MTEIQEPYHVSKQDIEEADALLAGVPDIEVFLPSKSISGYGNALYEKDNPTWVKLSVTFRDKWLGLLNGSRLAVFLAIALHIDENGKSFPGIELISKETGYSERQVIRAIKQLEAQGLLETIRIYLGNKVSRNFYTVKAFVSYGHDNPVSYQGDILSPAKEHQSDISNIKIMSQMSPQVEPVNLSRTINNTQEKLQNQKTTAKESLQMRDAEEIKKGNEDALFHSYVGTQTGYAQYPEQIRPVVERMEKLWYFKAPARSKKGGQFSFWIESCTEVLDACAEFGVPLLDKLHEDWKLYMESHGGCAPYTISSPKSLVSAVLAKAALMRSKNSVPLWSTNHKQVSQTRLDV